MDLSHVFPNVKCHLIQLEHFEIFSKIVGVFFRRPATAVERAEELIVKFFGNV